MRLPQTVATTSTSRPRTLPVSLITGVVLIAIAWPLAWFGPAPYAEHTFFPLWLGYILTVTGLTQYRTGSSLLRRDRRRFVLLFVYATPFWWGFEGVNRIVKNWHYLEPHHLSTLSYALQASLAFSTVVPAVLATAELYRSFRPFRPARIWRTIALSPPWLIVISLAGVIAGALALTFPKQAFPLVWLAAFFILDPLNALAGQRSLMVQVSRGRWDTVLVLFAAGITCGIFWEMWNFYSMPKWVYTVPYVGEPKVFEMPVLGYFGYLPFALEIYAIYQTMQGIVFRRPDTYLHLDRPALAYRRPPTSSRR